MPTEKKTKEKTESPKKTRRPRGKDFGDDLPKIVGVHDLKTLGRYVYTERSRYWKDGLEIICVELLEKHK